MTMWGIHNDALGAETVDGGFISVGWDRIGDLTAIGDDRERIKVALAEAYSSAKAGAIPVWAGMLRRFAFELRAGDVVVAPYKPDSTINFGVIEGEYEYHPDVSEHRHRRRVRWTDVGVARGEFPQPALYEIGSALTLFQVRKHEDVFAEFLRTGTTPPAPETAATTTDAEVVTDTVAQDQPNADRIDQHTRDFIIRTLLKDVSHEQFEQFTADLLVAMGYEARVTRFTSDGGIDVIAHKDKLGLEPPIIKVQCKHTTSTQGRPEVQQLIGTLASSEAGLFVTLGSYSREASDLERERQNLRLFSAAEITALTLQHYDDLPSRWRSLIPLRRVLVVDQSPEAG
ncbi:restriction endonuclease [Luteipulveratus flavus]|uniref:Restriction endonuclease n=1 Tax=Luteipulveratus flavus TaxID=3031728 RepID=A0ABT6CAU5_9MICO|nr:restriction endonuclease [Luteipulveratus sp. YIM 133296]MDF8265179.1 restriction endonuclease [Luteipulveratus sp. YIM 133296]